MVELRDLLAPVKQALDAWAGCVAGTIPIHRYLQLMVDVGFEGVDFEITNEQSVDGLPGAIGSAATRARKPVNPS